MKKVNLTIALTDLQGNAIKNNKGENILLNKEVATLLVMKEAKENILQRFELAQKLNSAKGEVEISDSEIELIKGALNGGGVTVLCAAQVLQAIANAKE